MFVPRPEILGYEFLDDRPYYYVILAITVFFTWVTVNYRKSLTGLGFGALRMSSIAAQSSGVGRTYHIVTAFRSEEHTSELQSLMRISYAVFCLKKKNNTTYTQ